MRDVSSRQRDSEDAVIHQISNDPCSMFHDPFRIFMNHGTWIMDHLRFEGTSHHTAVSIRFTSRQVCFSPGSQSSGKGDQTCLKMHCSNRNSERKNAIRLL